MLREAVDSDCDILFRWANDSETRKNSIRSEKIPYQEHVNWFRRKMQDDCCQIYLLLCDGKEAGQVRLDWKGNMGEISYVIAPEYRGMGFGSEILRLVEVYAQGKMLFGKVKKENIVSSRCFEKNHYEKTEKAEWLEYRKNIEGSCRNIAIITARGGSKRIPKKNIKLFCGKPILAYSIEAALGAGCFDRVMVSTDSNEIAEIARQYGAEVPFMRSEKTSDDFSTTADVLKEVLQEYEKRGELFQKMACIYPTAPFITGEKLCMAMEMLEQKDTMMAMPVVAFSYPPQRGYVMQGDCIAMKWKENYPKRSQDLEKMYHDAGQFYCYDIDAFIQADGMIVEGISPIVLDELEVQDIDNETDWKLAELKYQLLQNQ